MKKFLFLLFYLPLASQSFAQTREIDSLQTVLKNLEVTDTIYVDVLNDLGFRLSMTDQQASSYYINLATSKAKELNYKRGLIRAKTIKGNSFLIIGLPDQALTYYFEAMSYEAYQYPMDYVRLHNNIGEVYRRKEVYDSSLRYFNRALELANTTLTNYQPVIIYSNLGEVSLMKGEIDSAKEYFNACLTNALKTNNLRGVGYGYFGLAECAFETGAEQIAIDLMLKSIDYRRKASHQRGLIQSYLKLGNYYSSNERSGTSDSTLYYWKKAESLSKENEAIDLLINSYERLYNYFIDQSEIVSATHYLEKYKNLSDSIRNAEFIGNVALMKISLQAELNEAENKFLKEESKRRQSEEDAKLITIGLAFIVVLILGLNTFQYRQKKKEIRSREDEAKFTKMLLKFSSKLNKPQINLDEFIQELLKESRLILDCDRATYWSINPTKQTIYLHSKAERKQNDQIPTQEFTRDQFPRFYKDFLKNRTVAVSKVSKDARLTDVYESYFKPYKIESVLNSPILIDGAFFGFVSYVMTENKVRKWNINEERFVGSLSDLIVAAIGKQKRNLLKEEKEELIKKLRSRNESLKEFNSVISHNLREPLTQIIGLSDVLKSDVDTGISEYKEIIPKIFASSQRVDKVIKELSTILNESDPKPSDFRWLSVEKILKEALDLLKNEVSERGVELHEEITLKKLKSYKPYLIDILYHLLSNSLKFSDQEKSLKIEFSSYEDEFHYYLKLTDNGLGINLHEFGDKIFKMYQRFHLSIEGRGMGLFIVKSRVNAINGSITIQSKENAGTAFIIKLPKLV